MSFRASIININLALKATKYLSKEREYIPWEAALRSLSSLFDVFERNEVYGPMQVGSGQTSIESASSSFSVITLIYVLLRPTYKNKSSLCSIILLLWLETGRRCPKATLISKDLNISLNAYSLIRWPRVNQVFYVFCFVLRFTQIIALSQACSTGVEGCRDLTKHWFRQWMKDPEHNR